jgi:IS30 family transposase
LRGIVAQKLNDDGSPQQIAGWLRVSVGGDGVMRVSHETIYRSLFIRTQGRPAEGANHTSPEQAHHAARQALHHRGQERGRIRNAVSIRDRSAEIEARDG